MSNVLGIIPARGGSKGIKNKNLTQLGGKSLIQWTIEAAQKCEVIDAIILSTDSEEIALESKRLGVDVPTLRPESLSGDTAKTIDVLQYEISRHEDNTGVAVEDVILLQPTSPLRTSEDIDLSYQIYKKSGAQSFITVTDVETHPSIMYYTDGENLSPYTRNHQGVRRQDMAPLVLRNGAIYIASRAQILRGSLIADECAYYKMPKERSVNIDEPFDIEYAQWLLSRSEPCA